MEYKLYTWNVSVSYGGGVVFAVAKTVKGARKIAKKLIDKEYQDNWYASEMTATVEGEPKVTPLPAAGSYFYAE